jgi:hypothetical protein
MDDSVVSAMQVFLKEQSMDPDYSLFSLMTLPRGLSHASILYVGDVTLTTFLKSREDNKTLLSRLTLTCKTCNAVPLFEFTICHLKVQVHHCIKLQRCL